MCLPRTDEEAAPFPCPCVVGCGACTWAQSRIRQLAEPTYRHTIRRDSNASTEEPPDHTGFDTVSAFDEQSWRVRLSNIALDCI